MMIASSQFHNKKENLGWHSKCFGTNMCTHISVVRDLCRLAPPQAQRTCNINGQRLCYRYNSIFIFGPTIGPTSGPISGPTRGPQAISILEQAP